MTMKVLLTTHGEGGEITSIDLREVSSPTEFLFACEIIVTQHEGDEAHRMLDQLVTDLLSALGYEEGMGVFLRSVMPYHTKEVS